MKNIGTTIKIIRELRGLRQLELAKKIGVSPNYISLIENRRREPSLSFLKKVADELNLPISVFFWEDMTPTSESNGAADPALEINKLFWDIVRNRMGQATINER